MNRKILNITILVLSTLVLLVFPVFAQEESTASSESSQNLKERIERVVKEQSDEVAQELENISNKKQGFIGIVERVSNESVSIKTTKDTRILAINDEVTLIKNKKNIKVEDVAVGDWATVMGLVIDDSFVSRRIIFSSESVRPRDYTVVLGTITKIAKNNVDIKSRNDEEINEINISKSTSLQDFEANKISQVDLKEEQQVLAIIYTETDEDDDTQTKYLKVLRVLSFIETADE